MHAYPHLVCGSANSINQLYLQPYVRRSTTAAAAPALAPPAAAYTQIHPDTFYDVIDYVEHLYADFATEKPITQYFCLFCANEFNDMRLLIRHITESHRAKILDGTINLEQDFREIVRNKIISAEQNRTVISTDSQLYQCGQCQHMFHSLDVIAEHFTRCQGVSPQSQSIEQIKVEPPMKMSPQIKTESAATIVQTLESPSATHIETISHNEYVPYGCARCGRRWYTIYELSQHIIQCQDDTFYDSAKHLVSEYWVEAPKNQHIVINEDSTNITLKTTGLWLMPEPTEPSDSADSLRGFWVMPSSTTIYQDHHQERLQQQQQQQQQLQQQQQQQQSSFRQNTVSTIKSSPYSVISHHQSMPATDFVENAEATVSLQHTLPLMSPQSVSSDGLSDATYQMLNNADINQPEQRIYTNATTVITHTSPTVGAMTARSQRKRGGRTAVTTNANKDVGNSAVSAGAKKKRHNTKRGSATTPTVATTTLVAEELPPEQRYYLTYDENGALVPIQDSRSAASAISPSHRSTNAASDIKILDVVDIKNEPYSYGMRNLDEQSALQAAIQSITSSTESQKTSITYASTSTSGIISNSNGNNHDFSGYNIDDLSHLDKPILSTKPTPAIKPLRSKPQFVDSFFSFLMSRDTNKS